MSLNTQDLIAHMQACLGYSPREIKANGRWHDAGEGKNKNKLRYCVTEKTYVRQSEGNNAGEVVTVTVCTYRDYRSADGWHVWKSNEDRSYMSGEELAKLRAEIARKEREEEERKAKAAAEAARKAAFIWSKATKADANHPYLLKKQIKPFGIRQWNGLLVIPMRDVEGKLVGLQFINDEGNKRFLTGSPKKGAFCVIGASPSKIKSAWLCEGYATGVSLLEAKGGAVVICFDCGNMAHLVDVLREQHPDVELSVVGDDDRKTEGNPGRTVVAGILEKHSDVRVMMPAIADNAPIHLSDVNDLVVYRRQCGLPDGEVLIPLHTVH